MAIDFGEDVSGGGGGAAADEDDGGKIKTTKAPPWVFKLLSLLLLPLLLARPMMGCSAHMAEDSAFLQYSLWGCSSTVLLLFVC